MKDKFKGINMKKVLSEFEEVFGEGSHDMECSTLIAIIRDEFGDKINHYISESSMMSSPECVLYAIFKLLENDLKEKEYLSYEENNER